MVPASALPRRRPVTRVGRRSPSGERGSATVELAVIFPVFLILLFTGVQAALWYHARSLCLSAAQAGLRAGRVDGAGPAEGQAAAQSFLIRVADDSITDTQVSATATTSTLRVEVRGTAPKVIPIPGLSFTVTQSAEGGRDRFTTPDQP